MKPWILALGLLAAAGPAAAQSASSTQGHSALALAVIVGGYSPQLSAHQKAVLAQLLAHSAAAPGAGKMVVKTGAIDCRAGNVDITAFSCDLVFGGATRHLAGRAAHELYVTLGDAGVPEDGAAGTIHEAVAKLSCALDLAQIADKSGGGASCSFTAD